MSYGACKDCGNARAECECSREADAMTRERIQLGPEFEALLTGEQTPSLVLGPLPSPAQALADRLWVVVSIDVVPGHSPTPREYTERANVVLIELLMQRPPTETITLMQEVTRLLMEKIR